MSDSIRIFKLEKNATISDLKSGNFFPIDGEEGTKKFPAELLKQSKAVFYATPDVTTYSEISSAIDKGQDVVVVSRGNVYRLNETITPNFVFERTEVRDNGDVYLNIVSVNSSDVWSSNNTQIAKKTDVVNEAPNDGKSYVRKNRDWSEIQGDGGYYLKRIDNVTPQLIDGEYVARVYNNCRTNVSNVTGKENETKFVVDVIDATELINIEIATDESTYIGKINQVPSADEQTYSGLKTISVIRDWGYEIQKDYNKYEEPALLNGVSHKVVKIGKLLWIAEPLKIQFGTLNSDSRLVQTDKFNGYMYKQSSVCGSTNGYSEAFQNFVSSLGGGWRAPKNADMNFLFSIVSKKGSPYILNVDDGGTNSLLMNVGLSGSITPAGSAYSYGVFGYIGSCDTEYYGRLRNMEIQKNSNRIYTESVNDYYVGYRLCKDA